MTAPITAAEVADRVRPGQPLISPDGTRVLFTLRPIGRVSRRRQQAIWMAGERPAFPFTAGSANDTDPAWSPAGDRIAFLSDRAETGTVRLYVIPVDGGEARPLGNLSGGLSAPAWSPDGRAIAVLRTGDVPAPVDGRDARVVGQPAAVDHLWIVDAASGDARQVTTGSRSIRSYCWLPDGDGLAAIVTGTPDFNALYGPADLHLVPVGGGDSRAVARFAVVPEHPVPADVGGAPVIVVRGNDGRDDPSDGIFVVPAGGGVPRRVALDRTGSVEALLPSPTPGRVAAYFVERAVGHAVEIDLESGRVIDGGATAGYVAGSALSVSADGRRAAWVETAGDRPERVMLGPTGGQPADPGRCLVEFNRHLTARLHPTRIVGWTSDDGTAIEGILTEPRGDATGPRPLITLAHGGPAWHWDAGLLLSWHDWSQYLAGAGYAVLLPNSRGSTSYGAAFQRLLQDDVGGGELADILSGVRAMVDRGVADPDRLGIGGWSWGGYLAALAITRTDVFRAAVVGAGVANLASDHGQNDSPGMNLTLFPGDPYTAEGQRAYHDPSPMTHIHAARTPTLLLHGEADDRVLPAQSAELHRALTSLGVPTEFVLYPREGHGIVERAHQIDLLERLLGWYDRWLTP